MVSVGLVGPFQFPKIDLKSPTSFPKHHDNRIKMPIYSALRLGLHRTTVRGMATQARSTLKVALLPADGIGKEVIPVRMLRLLGPECYRYDAPAGH